MANKYIRHGETYNGDGTSSAAATSNGGVGAWNTINYFEGTVPAYGALAAGDVVYIRSKDASDADMTFTKSSGVVTNLGLSTATANNPTTWVLDNGTVWSGVDGILKYQNSLNTNRINFLANNYFVSKSTKLKYATTATSSSAGDGAYWIEIRGIVEGLHIDTSTYTNTSPRHWIGFGHGGTLINPVIKLGAVPATTDSTYSLFAPVLSTRADIYLVNPDIELTTSGLLAAGLFGTSSAYPRRTYVYGGRVWGTGVSTTNQPCCATNGSGSIQLVGFAFPRAMVPVSGTVVSTFASGVCSIEIIGCDDGLGGYHAAYWGWATSRTDSNPPVLSATSLDSASTPWSWRVYPHSASMAELMQLPTTKMFTGTSAAQVVTQQMLIADTMSPTKDSLWICVSYTDSTGVPRSEISEATGTLASSTAPWSATVWGAVTFNKYQLSVTTAYAVKQDSIITCTLFGYLKSATVNDIYFVDPDFSVVAA